jgi:hypothetical protein
MLIKALKYYLKKTGRNYLLPFIEGLSHLGRPAETFFPSELFEQGVSLFLAGLNNTMAFQSNPGWVWPYWLELQQNPRSTGFVPTGVNVVTANLTMRNWVSLGVAGSEREAMIDPVGMLTLKPFGWSVLPYLHHQGQLFLPPRHAGMIRQRYREGRLPCLVTEYAVAPDLSWSSETMALVIDKEEVISYNHTLVNRGDAPLEIRFGLSIRPYNPLTFGHINKIKFKNNLWRVNRLPGLLMMQTPDHLALGDRKSGEPIDRGPASYARHSVSSRAGFVAGSAEYDLRLMPNETRVIETLGLIVNRGAERKFTHLPRHRIARAKEEELARCRERSGQGCTVRLPDRDLEDAFHAVKNRMHVFDDGSHFSPGTFYYHSCWIRDSAFMALAFCNLGLRAEVLAKIPRLMKLQRRDGSFSSQKGEWDGTGQILYTVLEILFRFGTRQELQTWYGHLRRGWLWIEKTRKKSKESRAPHAGLLPAGISAEHFGPNDHYFWDNFWSLAGMAMLKKGAELLGEESDAWVIHESFEEYRADLQDAMDHAIAQSGGGALPPSPYRKVDTASIGTLAAISPLDLFSCHESWVAPTVAALCATNLMDGLFFQSIIHTGFNTYLSLQLARVLLNLGDGRCHAILDAVLKLGRGVHAWPEAAHPLTKGGCMGDGDHGWAAAEFINVVRNLFVMEEEGRLVLAKGMRAEWISSGRPMAITQASSRYGTISWELRATGNELHFRYSLHRAELQHPAPLILCLPKGLGAMAPISPEGEITLASDQGPFHAFHLHRDEGDIYFGIVREERG